MLNAIILALLTAWLGLGSLWLLKGLEQEVRTAREYSLDELSDNFLDDPKNSIEKLGLFKSLSEEVRSKEPGNIFYQVAKDRENENTYLVLEHYRDQDSVDAHGKSDHFRSVGRSIGECLDGPPIIKYLDSIK